MKDIPERITLELHLDRLRSNLAEIRRRLGAVRLLTVVKADAYAMGAQAVAKAAKEAGTVRFGVATLNEALALLPLGVPVQLLSAALPEEIAPAVEHRLHIPVIDLETGRRVSEEAKKRGLRAQVQIAIDSGMGRVGIRPDEAPAIIRELHRLDGLELCGIYSHFPAAVPGDAETPAQIDRFIGLVNLLKQDGITFCDIHMAASDGFCNFPAATVAPFTMARIGLDLYGVGPTRNFRPVMTLKSRLAAVRLLPAGSSIGYSRTHVLKEATWIGTVAAGYADGIPLALSNRGAMLVHGRLCPVVGRVSMDYTMISLSEVPQAKVGDEVVCWGDGENGSILPADWAKIKQTHVHEILCSLGHRVARNVIG